MSSVLRSADPHCIDCLDQEPVAAHGGPAAARQVAFWLLAFMFAATMLGTTLPTPLYLWVPKTSVTWADALRSTVGLIQRSALAGPILAGPGVG